MVTRKESRAIVSVRALMTVPSYFSFATVGASSLSCPILSFVSGLSSPSPMLPSFSSRDSLSSSSLTSRHPLLHHYHHLHPQNATTTRELPVVSIDACECLWHIFKMVTDSSPSTEDPLSTSDAAFVGKGMDSQPFAVDIEDPIHCLFSSIAPVSCDQIGADWLIRPFTIDRNEDLPLESLRSAMKPRRKFLIRQGSRDVRHVRLLRSMALHTRLQEPLPTPSLECDDNACRRI